MSSIPQIPIFVDISPRISVSVFGNFFRFSDFFLISLYIKTIGEFDTDPEISNPPNFVAI